MVERKQLVLIGLGKMGAAIGTHLVEQGYTVHGYDRSSTMRTAAAGCGILVHDSIEDAITAQMGIKVVWIMVPTANVSSVIAKVRKKLSKDDVIIDGGNSFFKDSIHRHHDLAAEDIHFIDCGTSGGVTGARFGASLMVGGDKEVIEKHKEVFTDLAVADGFGHVGEAGAGHFVKMVHNAIEYGMMGAIAEGINILDEHQEGLGLDIHEALKPYQHGSIIESKLMDWIVSAYHTEGYLEKIAGEVPQGKTEMDMEYLAAHENVRVLDAALMQRKLSRLKPNFIGTLIAAMRHQFGGHTVLNKERASDTKK